MTLKQSLINLEKLRQRSKFLCDINRDTESGVTCKSIEKIFKTLEWLISKYVHAIRTNAEQRREIKRLNARVAELKNLLALAEKRGERAA
jgi:cell shape-determining protein MreC